MLQGIGKADEHCDYQSGGEEFAVAAEYPDLCRIAAIPVVVGCVFGQSIMDGPLWLRWVALAVFIAAGVTDFLDGYYARIWHQHSAFAGCSIRSPTSSW